MSAVGAAGRASGLAPGDGPPGAAGSVVDAVAGLGLDGTRAPDSCGRGLFGSRARWVHSSHVHIWGGPVLEGRTLRYRSGPGRQTHEVQTMGVLQWAQPRRGV